jgi:putative ABC transport system permease protein
LSVVDVPGARLGLYVAAAALAGVLAAIAPARRAAKVDVLRAVAAT